MRHLVVHQIVCKRHRILPFFELLDETKATCHGDVYADGTRTEQLNYDPLQITVHARLLGHNLISLFDRPVGTGDVLKFQVVHSPARSAPGRSKTGTCERGLRRRSTTAGLLRLWVRIPPWAWMSVCCECCVLSGRGLCDALITRPEESYRL